MTHDAIVVGGGPAGLAAATWLGRYRCTTLLIDAGEPRNRWTSHTHGYLGWDPATPKTLLQAARAQVDVYDEVTVHEGRAVAARRDGDNFVVRVERDGSSEEVGASRLVLATGVRDVFPDIPGFFDHYGTSVFHCPTCDGYEARGLPVVAIGWSAQIADFAIGLLNWASSVAVVTDGAAFEGDERLRRELAEHRIALHEEDAVALVGSARDLRGIGLRGGTVLPCRMAFFSIAHEPVNALARGLGCELDPDGSVAVNPAAMTSVPGVYAAGDLTSGLQLIQVAAGKGALAGVGAARSLRPGLFDPPHP
ncbi:MAG: NAD(P)/FAD-dependent oxidoreductase [Acidimicrobiia bacterium]